MQQSEFDFNAGRAARDAGIKQAKDHADAVSDGWSDRAYVKLLAFMKENKTFMVEDFRSHCALHDFDLPPNPRAFASIIVRAAKAGLVTKIGVGQVKNAKAHMAHAGIWQVNN